MDCRMRREWFVYERAGALFIYEHWYRPDEGLTAHQKDAPGKLLFKSRAPGPANGEDAALLNAHHTAGSTGNEVILHTKTF
ncbi:hypothetical protein [Paraflavitalea speifideaquila]|uniref:hypothetical protein n=1 Tax=Paraflavitalea speifideaquila TaxID=3076558 RepID=UPI0028EEE0B6|nr:hypothetical protein [Paraflavitalea speifideiaquila]